MTLWRLYVLMAVLCWVVSHWELRSGPTDEEFCVAREETQLGARRGYRQMEQPPHSALCSPQLILAITLLSVRWVSRGGYATGLVQRHTKEKSRPGIEQSHTDLHSWSSFTQHSDKVQPLLGNSVSPSFKDRPH